MESIQNPFSPGAGSPPPELVGRDSALEMARILLGRILNKRSEKSLLLTGFRGVGKTVLLNEIERLAKSSGYCTIFIEAHEDKPFRLQLVLFLRSLLFNLDRMGGISSKVKRGLAVLRSFISGFNMTVGDVTFGIDVDPEKGAADSGDLDVDLPNLFVAVGEAAEERGCAVALLIDEMQYLSQKELGALIAAMHRIQQLRLPLLLLGAGLPTLPGLAGEAKSYAERLFHFPDVGALSEEEASMALKEPVQSVGVTFNQDALKEIFRLTKGYPYFIQEWGYQAWNFAQTSPITLQTVQEATATVISRLDRNFFRVRFDRLTPSEKSFLRAMAELGSEPQRIGDIAEVLQVRASSVGPIRARLIKKAMIYSPSYGDLAFTVPLFDEFMLRAIPQLSRENGA